MTHLGYVRMCRTYLEGVGLKPASPGLEAVYTAALKSTFWSLHRILGRAAATAVQLKPYACLRAGTAQCAGVECHLQESLAFLG